MAILFGTIVGGISAGHDGSATCRRPGHGLRGGIMAREPLVPKTGEKAP